jgi:glutamyl-tRNA synthetase
MVTAANLRTAPVTGVKAAKDAQNTRSRRRMLEPGLKALTLDEIRALAGEHVRAPKKPKVRFAPSPTGRLHIGNARTALMNYLFAKKIGAQFLLRIEDTDQLRSKPEHVDTIKRSLDWMGIKWDGEIVYQSQRTELYRRKVQELIDKGLAYKDNTGAVFFKMPEEGSLIVNDRVKGRVTINVTEAEGTKDFIIQRSDGSPMFLLANVVDDGEQGITHVIRGDDHLGNAARQIPLFRALGYDVPEFYHLPLIHGDDGAKLSKRHGAQSVVDYQEMGYDRLVFVNHLARLGMNYGTEQTISVEELAERFDPLGFSKSRSLLGFDRLSMRSLHHLKKLDTQTLIKELEARTGQDTVTVHLPKPADADPKAPAPIGEEPNLLRNLMPAQKEALAEGAKARASTAMEMVEIGQFVMKPAVYTEEAAKVQAPPKMRQLMARLLEKLRELPDNQWTLEKLSNLLEAFNKANDASYRTYGNPLRWMLTGVTDGLPLHHTMAILGKAETVKRLAERTA